jgi:hypothetical protein
MIYQSYKDIIYSEDTDIIYFGPIPVSQYALFGIFFAYFVYWIDLPFVLQCATYMACFGCILATFAYSCKLISRETKFSFIFVVDLLLTFILALFMGGATSPLSIMFILFPMRAGFSKMITRLSILLFGVLCSLELTGVQSYLIGCYSEKSIPQIKPQVVAVVGSMFVFIAMFNQFYQHSRMKYAYRNIEGVLGIERAVIDYDWKDLSIYFVFAFLWYLLIYTLSIYYVLQYVQLLSVLITCLAIALARSQVVSANTANTFLYTLLVAVQFIYALLTGGLKSPFFFNLITFPFAFTFSSKTYKITIFFIWYKSFFIVC